MFYVVSGSFKLGAQHLCFYLAFVASHPCAPETLFIKCEPRQ